MAEFRLIDIEGFTPAELPEQPAPQLLTVQLEQLVIDTRYQRSLSIAGRRSIQKIANFWDWKKYQPISIAPTNDGRFAVVDGQHRAHAAAVVGLATLPAYVVPMTPQEQAEAFTSVNTTRTRVPAAALFKAQLAAGHPAALAEAAAVEAAGCRLMTYTPSAAQRRPGDVFTYALIRSMVANGEAEAVTTGLRAIRESEQGNVPSGNLNEGTRVYDSLVLKAWLPAVASSQLFLRLPLSDVFDQIDWDEERSNASRRARQLGGSVNGHLIDRVKGFLREAQRIAA